MKNDFNPKLNELKALIIVVVAVTYIIFGFFTYKYYSLDKEPKPETKVEPKTEVKYLLGEKKECQDKGGRFIVNFFNQDTPEYIPKSDYSFELKCIKEYTEGNKDITETIFDYKI